MQETGQSYSNHTRLHPPFHFFMLPVMGINMLWSVWKLYQAPSIDTGESLLAAIALFVMAVLTRVYPLKAQDRVIRLEERLRYQKVLSPALAEKASDLPVAQVIALRFASDAELPALVQQVIDGKLADTKAIKEAIKSWRGDYHRV